MSETRRKQSWTGSLATWKGTVPYEFGGYHKGLFDGKYKVEGSGLGKKLTWHAETYATVPVVKIIQCPDKMLVEGKFILKAEANPEISDAFYSWSINGNVDDFSPNPTTTKTTEFYPKQIKSPTAKSLVVVKYSDMENNKEAMVTRGEYFKRLRDLLGPGVIQRDQGNLYICESNRCSRYDDDNTIHLAFYGLFQYEIYDQYREFLGESERGGSVPYVIERHIIEPYSVFNNPVKITDSWVAVEDCKMGDTNNEEEGDEVYSTFAFKWLGSENLVGNFVEAENVHIDWIVSVQEGTHQQNTVRHQLRSYFIDVIRENESSKLISFKLMTTYVRVGRFIK